MPYVTPTATRSRELGLRSGDRLAPAVQMVAHAIIGGDCRQKSIPLTEKSISLARSSACMRHYF